MNREESRPTAVEPEARELIGKLARMRPEDEWGDKFYAALAALWRTVKGSEIPAMGAPPHLVMADLIEGVAWSRRLAVEPDGLPLDPHRLGGLIERAIRQSKRESGGLLPDGWTLVEMALAYPSETPTEPSAPTPAPPEARE